MSARDPHYKAPPVVRKCVTPGCEHRLPPDHAGLCDVCRARANQIAPGPATLDAAGEATRIVKDRFLIDAAFRDGKITEHERRMAYFGLQERMKRLIQEPKPR